LWGQLHRLEHGRLIDPKFRAGDVLTLQGPVLDVDVVEWLLELSGQ
jgi:hypothetical protein